MTTSGFDHAFNQAFPNDGTQQSTGDESSSQSGVTASPAPGTSQESVPYATPTPSGGSSTGRRAWDPHGDFNFVIEIDGIVAGSFQKCDGISFEADVIEYRDSMDPYPRYRPGLKRFGRIRLTRGYVENSSLWDWCQSIMHGKIDRRHGAIHLYNDDGETPAVTYRFLDAWPANWSGFKLDGLGRGTLVEEIELVTECVMKTGY
jgi:phage tail-like protein